MEKLVKQLKEYFDNTPKDVLKKEAEEWGYLNEIEPYVPTDEEDVKKISPLLKELNEFLNNVSEEELEENWKQLEKFSKIGSNALCFVNE